MRVDVARVVPSSATDAEPARVFLQDRIQLWAFWVFALSFGFYVTNILTSPFIFTAPSRVVRMLVQAGTLDHLAAALVFGTVWILTRRQRVSMPALRVLDLSTLIVGCALFALMGATRAAGTSGDIDTMLAIRVRRVVLGTVMARAMTVFAHASAVGYYLLTGHPVFDAASVVEGIGHHLHSAPLSPSIRLGWPVPHELEALVMQCLRKLPEERPDSARALRSALRRCRFVPTWTSEDAASWWRTFRSSETGAAPRAADDAEQITMTVDAAERFTHTSV